MENKSPEQELLEIRKQFQQLISEKSKTITANHEPEKSLLETKQEFQQLIKETLGSNIAIIAPSSELVNQQPSDIIEATKTFLEKKTGDANRYVNFMTQPDTRGEIKNIETKLKYLENWITKVSLAGPGSGEVRFRWLDDVNRSTINDTNKILRFSPQSNNFFFGYLSGDQGPITSLSFDLNGANTTPVPGMLEWNNTKDCLNIHQGDNSTLQVGLENYIRVHNSTGGVLDNGTVVQFVGVNGDNETPLATRLTANSSMNPLYVIGVLTNDIADGGIGRATTLGEVRDIDTTGSGSGETWGVGDILWASPTLPGKLTKVRPTAPDSIISIAAVLKVGVTDGILLIRPTIPPKLFYGSFYSNSSQTALVANTAYPITLNNVQIASGFHIANSSYIVAENAGLYNFAFSIQVESNVSATKNFWIWYRKNGQDVPWSASKVGITSNKESKVVAWNFIESLHIGETFQLFWAAEDTTIYLAAPAATAFCPAIPSVILTVNQVTL